MNYENFIVTVKEAVEELCPNDRVVVKEIIKNNSTVLDSISVFRKEEYIAPTIYLNTYYDEYNEGKSIESIAEDIINISDMYRGRVDIDLDLCFSFENVKNRLFCKVVNHEQNKMILENCPYREFLNLAIVYYCVEKSSDNEYGSWLITNAIFEKWEVTEEQLYETSMHNLRTQYEWQIIDIWDMLSQLNGEIFCNEDDKNLSENSQMYVLTNSIKVFGASAILINEILKDFGKEHGNFYILPSSIHELILVISEDSLDALSLKNMVEEVNEMHVPTMEFLSDDIYYYDCNEGLIRLTF